MLGVVESVCKYLTLCSLEVYFEAIKEINCLLLLFSLESSKLCKQVGDRAAVCHVTCCCLAWVDVCFDITVSGIRHSVKGRFIVK